MKPVLSLAELARLLGVSRRSALRMLVKHRIPFEQERRGSFPYRGTGYRILVADLRMYAPRLFSGLRDVGELAEKIVIQAGDSS